jgi:hemerythrin
MINKDTIPKVAYEMMNEVHNEEADLLNALESLLDETTLDIQAVDVALRSLITHTHEHFSNEEKLMKEVSFPAFMMHQGEHLRVLGEMEQVIQQWQAQHDLALLREYFLGSLQEWLMVHISTMDTITAQFISARKGCA